MSQKTFQQRNMFYGEMKMGGGRVRENILWYQTKVQVGMVYLYLGIGKRDITGMIGVVYFPMSSVIFRINGLRKFEVTVGPMVIHWGRILYR